MVKMLCFRHRGLCKWDGILGIGFWKEEQAAFIDW